MTVYLASGCGPPSLPTGPEDGSKYSSVKVKNKGVPEPWLLEWEPDVLAELARELQRGTVLVHYADGVLELLSGCEVAGRYEFTAMPSRPQKTHEIDSSAGAYTELGIKIVTVGGGFEKGDHWSLEYVVSGSSAASEEEVPVDALTGECARATHAVARVTHGAYRLYAAAGVDGGVAVDVASAAKVGVHSSKGQEVIKQDGNYDTCSNLDTAADASACGGLLKLELRPLTD